MTIADKAKELYNKYAVMWHASTEDVKKCAIICVDQIIESRPNEPNPDRLESLSSKVESSIRYWEQVKSAIQNL